MKREIINNAGASAGKLTIGNQTFRVVLQPMAKEPRQTKQAAAKPAAPAKPKAKPQAKAVRIFPANFKEMLQGLEQVKKSSKPRRNKLGSRNIRFKIGKANFEGSFTHFLTLAVFMLLEANGGTLDQLSLFEGMVELLAASGIEKNVRFGMPQCKSIADVMVRNKHLTAEGITYTFKRYPSFKTLALVVD